LNAQVIMQIAPPLIKRLVATKMLFDKARDHVASESPFSEGLGVLALQDSIEMFLRVLAEFLHAEIRDKMAFEQLLDRVSEKVVGGLTFRSSLVQLNKSRVSFKHYGLQPNREDLEKLLNDARQFIERTAREVLSINLFEITLLELVDHTRTRNWLRMANEKLQSGDYHDSIKCSAIALGAFKHGQTDSTNKLTFHDSESWENESYGGTLRELRGNQLVQQEMLSLLVCGISIEEFNRFDALRPNVQFSWGGTFYISGTNESDVIDVRDAEFTLKFVLEYILRLRKFLLPRELKFRGKPTLAVRVLEPTELLVSHDIEAEVIKAVKVGDIFSSWKSRHNQKNEFIEVQFESGIAFLVCSKVECFEGGI
ncbi:MAG: hypothetical protein K8F30_01720, partial [Taibaiella sp.]|nr:hypothetical protein [Taibaiella sp.]